MLCGNRLLGKNGRSRIIGKNECGPPLLLPNPSPRLEGPLLRTMATSAGSALADRCAGSLPSSMGKRLPPPIIPDNQEKRGAPLAPLEV